MTTDVPRPTTPGIGNGARWSDILATMHRLAETSSYLPETIKVTQEQLDQVPKAPQRKPWEPDMSFAGVPVELVDTVEESTAYQLAHPSTPSELPASPTLDPVPDIEPAPPTRRGWITRTLGRLVGESPHGRR